MTFLHLKKSFQIRKSVRMRLETLFCYVLDRVFAFLKLIAINLKNIPRCKLTQILHVKRSHDDKFFRVRIFSDTKFPQTFSHWKVPDSYCICGNFVSDSCMLVRIRPRYSLV